MDLSPYLAPHLRNKHRGVEQLVARWAHNPKVVCSSQASATTKNNIAEWSSW